MADPKPFRAERDNDAERRLDFKVAVLALDQGCVLHDDETECVPPLQAHHVVTQQQLRHAGREDLLWDARNGATVCEGTAHRRHTLALERIPYERLPVRCVDFATEHGFLRILDRYYPRTSASERTP